MMTDGKLLLFNLRTDAADPILGFTTGWINALASRYQVVDVLTMHAGRLALADNVTVHSVGRELGLSEVRRAVNFYRILTRLLSQRSYAACFAHMMPLFAAMGGPLLSLAHVPTTLWYTHRQRTRQLALALRASRRVVTAVESSFPIKSPKVRALGHGIDTDLYAPQDYQIGERLRVVYVARLTPIKHQHILIQAAQRIPQAEFVLIGDVPDGYDDAYKQQLVQQVAQSGQQQQITFAGPQTPVQIREWLRGAAVAVNLAPVGLFDKAPLEAMSAGVPTIVSNPAFESVTDAYNNLLHIPAPDALDALVARLQDVLMLDPVKRTQVGLYLRDRVIAQHSMAQLLERLISVLHTGEISEV